jgi:high-affinity iron transporter
MFVPFLIMLREGLEAALIVSLIASYLKRTQRGRWIGVMWIGVFLPRRSAWAWDPHQRNHR